MNNGGNPAVVKIYQLGGEGNFKSTPLSAFWRDDRGALGNELVTAPRKVTVYPDESERIELELAEKTKYIGIAANLRKPEREKWRSVHSIEGMGDQISVTVETNKVEVEVEESSIPDMGIGDQGPVRPDSLRLFTLLNDVSCSWQRTTRKSSGSRA